MDTPPASPNSVFEASFSRYDAALFAIALGYGSSQDTYNDELCYVWEEHDNFCLAPTFVASLLWWATLPGKRPRCRRELPPFPSPMMQHMGLLPRGALKQDGNTPNLNAYPVLHVWQALTWHRPMKHCLPQKSDYHTVVLEGSFGAVQPKSIGTFVRSQTQIRPKSTVRSDTTLYCTLQSTSLILGLDPDLVAAQPTPPSFHKCAPAPSIPKTQPPSFHKDISAGVNQALLYRMASGDSNHIHVDPKALPNVFLSDDTHHPNKPVLHGMATLGLAARALEHGLDWEWVHLEAQFRKLVFVGDTLRLCAWTLQGPPASLDKANKANNANTPIHEIVFQVVRTRSTRNDKDSDGDNNDDDDDEEENVVLDRGYARLSKTTTKARL